MSGDQGRDDVGLFVQDLRDLWIRDGRRKFASLAQRTGVGKSTLHEAVTKHDRLPSERTVGALVGVLAPAEVDSWLARRSALATPRSAPAAPSSSATAAIPLPHRRPAALTVGVVVGVVLVALASFAMGRVTAPPSDPAPRQASVADGVDPIEAGCVPDAGTAATTSIKDVGTLRLIFSTRCDAFWAKIERHDGLSIGNRVEVAVYARDGGKEQVAEEPDLTSAYTFLLVREDAVTAVCARGAVWVGDTRHELPDAC